jgi:NAD(P)-dependent dehydrogenase (short-subunit alcohol dehydrogenase family)
MNKSIVVIGASSGIGAELSAQLANKGIVVYAFSRERRDLIEHENIIYQKWDASSENDVLQGLPEVIDGLVYCPGSITLLPFQSIKPAKFLDDFQINLLGAVRSLQACLPGLKKSSSASVILYSTVAVQTGMAFHASVASAKGAVEGLTRSLAAEWASFKIRVNCIAPSLTETPLAQRLINSPEKKDASAKRHPLNRIGNAADIAAMSAFLLNDEASWITGQIIHVDGGMSSLRML